MGIGFSFRGSLEIEPPIREEDREEFDEFVKLNSYPRNPRANYSNPWKINEQGRLECCAVKFCEHDAWMRFLYDKFFKPKHYDVHGSILYASDGGQEEWELLKYENGYVIHVQMDPLMIDMDFWEIGAEYARQQMEKEQREREEREDYVAPKLFVPDPELYGGLFESEESFEKNKEWYRSNGLVVD